MLKGFNPFNSYPFWNSNLENYVVLKFDELICGSEGWGWRKLYEPP